jgi:Ca2+-binding EF-hand superfamily protein
MALIDLNGNGVIDYSEWLVATVKIEEIVKVKKLKMAFQYFDRDSKGNITLEDIKGVMANSGIQQNEGLDE